jgi:hypothetical protein
MLHQRHNKVVNNKVVGASRLLGKCFYGNDRKKYVTSVTDGHLLPLIIIVAKLPG